jgi:two-component system response regulator
MEDGRVGARVADAAIPFALVDDDQDDRLLLKRAAVAAQIAGAVLEFPSGEEFVSFMSDTVARSEQRPGLVLLDLNMPRMTGVEVLATLKADPDLREMPVVILTTSSAGTDIEAAYRLGAATFITKPSTFRGLVAALDVIARYWFDLASIP